MLRLHPASLAALLSAAFLVSTAGAVALPELADDALSAEVLLENSALLAELAVSPDTGVLVKYLVECALPAEAAFELPVDGEARAFHGRLGLAPEWADGQCDEACQEWVSACLLTRVNAYSVPFELTGRGENPAIPVGEDLDYTVEEGAFFGNIFVDPPLSYACRGAGWDPLAMSLRTCTLPGSRCGIAVVGPCGPVDGTPGAVSQRHACESRDEAGFYRDCHDRASVPGVDAFPQPDHVFRRVITTYLRPTTFRRGVEVATCDDAPPPPPTFDPYPGPDGEAAAVGDRCTNEDACPADDLLCDAQMPGGMCTKGCTDTGEADSESAECGAGGTCLVFPAGGRFCVAACTPGVPGGDCPAGRVCTLPWLTANPDDPRLPGCFPFCSSDDDCNPGTHCHLGTGSCVAAVLPEGDADGEPCEPAVGGCHGFCLRASAEPTEGLCGSLFNGALSDRCGTPGVRPHGPRGEDDLGLCMFKGCRADAECTAPLVCGETPIGRGCRWP